MDDRRSAWVILALVMGVAMCGHAHFGTSHSFGLGYVVYPANYLAFFRDFDRQYRAFIPNTSEAVAALQQTELSRERLFFVPYAHWIDPRNVGAALGSIEWAESNVVAPDAQLPDAVGGLAFVLNRSDVDVRDRLVAAYPRGSSTLVRSDVGKDFVLFVVPA